MTTFPHLRAAIVSQPWAILPDRLEAIAEVLERRFSGARLAPEEIAAIKGDRAGNGDMGLFAASQDGIGSPIEARGPSDGAPSGGGVIAVINIMGIIAQHAHQVDNISGPGGTSVERITNSLRASLAEPSVVGIIFNIDSPGGNVGGVQALADEIFRARGRKPMVAQVNSVMASAAYWIGAAADEIVMSPGAQAGSIGVYTMHRDASAAAEKEGFKMTFISAGKFKVEGNQFEPLGDDARAAVQAHVDSYYSDFVGSVARYRGVKPDAVRSGFGQGRMEKDREAVKSGLADRVATIDDTFRRLSTRKAAPAGTRAEALSAMVAEGFMTIDEMQALQGTAPKAAQASENTAEPAVPPVDDAATGSTEVAPTEEETVAASNAERDAFRRRRHAHRLRSA